MQEQLAVEISNVLATNQTITFLRIGGHRYGCAGASALCRALLRNTTLTELSLAVRLLLLLRICSPRTTLLMVKLSLAHVITCHTQSSDIRDEGARAIAELLSVNTTLQTLSLFGNHIGLAGIVPLSEAIAKTTTLKCLSFGVRCSAHKPV